jgi:uncharacterized protein with PIN domain
MSKRRIPTKEMVVSIIKEVIKRRKVITTLNEMWLLVLTNLKKINKRFVLSPQRIKQLIVQIPEIEVKVKTRRGSRKKINSCPVCNSKLSKVYGRNLLGNRIHTGYKCKKCSYRTGMIRSIPRKYIFVRKYR